MKAVKIQKAGGPEVLELQDITLRKPVKDEVLIEHVAIGLNYIDTYHRSGLYPLKLPSGIGLEASGIIKEVGPNVSDFSVGDKIAYAGQPIGAYSTHRIYPTKNLVKVPESIDLNIVATLMTKGLTAFYLLYKTYAVKAGETILFHAAAGGVGQIFCQWAKSLGCKVIGTVGADEKINIAKNNGCDHVINYSKDDFAEKVLEFTKKKGVPVVYDGVGKDTFQESINSLSTRGLMVSFGQSSGMIEKIDMHKIFNPKSLFYTRPSLMGYTLNRDELLSCSNNLFKKMKDNKVKNNIYKKFKLEDASKAHELLQSRKSFGSIILEP